MLETEGTGLIKTKKINNEAKGRNEENKDNCVDEYS
jgi:hypothetical protein